MNKLILALCFTVLFSLEAYASEMSFSQNGRAGVYYGIAHTQDNNNLHNLPNRLVFRADGNLKSEYKFWAEKALALNADYTLVVRQHDKNYRYGDWRFYPYTEAKEQKFGKLAIGYNKGAGNVLHVGAKDVTWFGIQDSNFTYWLSSANWENKFKKVSFATPKSTNIMADGRAFKFSYYTPEISNTIWGFSYTPKNENRRGMVSRYADYEKTDDGYSMAMQNKWKLNNDTFYTSVAYGLFNRTDNEWAFAARWLHGDLTVSTSYKKAYINGSSNPITTTDISEHLPEYFDNYREGEAWDFSVGYDFDKLHINFAFLHTEAENTRHQDNLYLQSNRYELNKYVELYLVNGFINSKGLKSNSKRNNKGYAIISGCAIKY